MDLLLWSAIGVIVGSIITNIIWFIKSRSGALKIDRSDPECDKYLLCIDKDMSTLHKKKRLILRVEKVNDLSQK